MGSLIEYKKTLKHTLKPRTITFLIKDKRVLLGYKKEGFGMGKFIGIGGKVEERETIEQAAQRELHEEICIRSIHLQRVAYIDFYFPFKRDESWNQQVIVFISTEWEGTERETEEIKPQWFELSSLPFESMWDDARYWLMKILTGEKFHAEFLFNKELRVEDYAILESR